MKITRKIFIINALISGSFLLGIGGASAQVIAPQACNTPSGICTAAAPWCNSGYDGLLVPAGDTSGSCQATNPGYTMRSANKKCSPSCNLNEFCNQGRCELIRWGSRNRIPLPTPLLVPTTPPCSGKVVPDYSLTTIGKANVLEAFWNFITHKRGR